MHLPRTALAGLLAVAGLAAAAGPAAAVHWPQFGGDNGRSGYQPVDEGAAPVTSVYAKTADTEKFIKTSIVYQTTGHMGHASPAACQEQATRGCVHHDPTLTPLR